MNRPHLLPDFISPTPIDLANPYPYLHQDQANQDRAHPQLIQDLAHP